VPEDQTAERAAVAEEAASESLIAENLRLKEELLTLRDALIGHEARLGEALGQVRRLEAELVRYRGRMEELDAIQRSRSWRIIQLLQSARALARRLG
jgi:hypothetical protein